MLRLSATNFTNHFATSCKRHCLSDVLTRTYTSPLGCGIDARAGNKVAAWAKIAASSAK
jgi:formyltetrahydrofolate hydrolase